MHNSLIDPITWKPPSGFAYLKNSYLSILNLNLCAIAYRVAFQCLIGFHIADQDLLAASRDTTSGIVASIIATLLMVFGATRVFTQLKISLDEIWGSNQMTQPPMGGLIKTRLLSFA